MRRIEEFLRSGDVRRVSPDPALARSLVEFAARSREAADMLNADERMTTLAFEAAYDALRQLVDAILALDGYRSYSHVASISYLGRFPEVGEADVERLDNARERRNGAKYYARAVTPAETRELIEFHDRLRPVLLRIIEGKTRGERRGP